MDKNQSSLSVKEEEEFLGNVTDWEIDRKGTHFLTKTSISSTFMEAVRLLRDIAEIAESENHHPDFHLYYNKLKVDIYSHKAGGLTESDFILASKVDDLLKKKNLL